MAAGHKCSGGPGTACTQRTYRSTTAAVRPGTGAGAVRHRDGAPQRIFLAAWPAGHKCSGGPGTARTQRTYRSTTAAVRRGTGAGAVRHRDGAPQRILLAPWPPVKNALMGLARPAHSAPIGPRLPLSGAAPVRGRYGTAMERRRGFCWRHGPPVINALVGLARPAHSAPIGPRLPLSGPAPVRGRCGTAMEQRRGFCWRHGRRS